MEVKQWLPTKLWSQCIFSVSFMTERLALVSSHSSNNSYTASLFIHLSIKVFGHRSFVILGLASVCHKSVHCSLLSYLCSWLFKNLFLRVSLSQRLIKLVILSFWVLTLSRLQYSTYPDWLYCCNKFEFHGWPAGQQGSSRAAGPPRTFRSTVEIPYKTDRQEYRWTANTNPDIGYWYWTRHLLSLTLLKLNLHAAFQDNSFY